MSRIPALILLFCFFLILPKEAISQKKRCKSKKMEIVLIIDISGSSSPYIPGQKRAIKNLLDKSTKLSTWPEYGLVTFSEDGKIIRDLPSSYVSIEAGLKKMKDRERGWTRIYTGLELAEKMFNDRKNSKNEKIIMLFSDGVSYSIGEDLKVMEKLKNNNVKIFSLHYPYPGHEIIGSDLMKKLASEPLDLYYRSTMDEDNTEKHLITFLEKHKCADQSPTPALSVIPTSAVPTKAATPSATVPGGLPTITPPAFPTIMITPGVIE